MIVRPVSSASPRLCASHSSAFNGMDTAKSSSPFPKLLPIGVATSSSPWGDATSSGRRAAPESVSGSQSESGSSPACPRVRASHDPGLSAPIPPGCPHAGGVGAGQALMRQGNHLGRRGRRHPVPCGGWGRKRPAPSQEGRLGRLGGLGITGWTKGFRTLTEPRSFRGGPWTAFSMPLRVATELGSGNQGVSEPHQG